MKVWAVFHEEKWYDGTLEKLFDSQEKAKQYIESFPNQTKDNYYSVEEWEVE